MSIPTANDKGYFLDDKFVVLAITNDFAVEYTLESDIVGFNINSNAGSNISLINNSAERTIKTINVTMRVKETRLISDINELELVKSKIFAKKL